MQRALPLALISLVMLTACQHQLGPGEAWYTYRNQQNSFAKLRIDGDTIGPSLRPHEVRTTPLLKSTPHTVVILHGNYTAGSAGFTNYHEEFQLDSTDHPFILTWANGTWQQTEQP